MVLVACRLARSLQREDPQTEYPIFEFWMGSLRNALAEDPYWGDSFWTDVYKRAKRLEEGIQHLVAQCRELEEMALSNNELRRNFGVSSKTLDPFGSPRPKPLTAKPASEKGSKHEDAGFLETMILGCWTTLLADANRARAIEITPTSSTVPLIRSMTIE